MKHVLLGALALALSCAAALAAPIQATGIFQTATIGTSASQLWAAGVAQNYIYLGNPSAPGTNTVFCRFTATPTVNGAGTISLAPGQSFTMEASQIDTAALSCISSGASTPFTYAVR